MREGVRPSGPLRGVRIVEFAGIGPAPFAAMLLSDMGAEVVCIARPGQGRRDARDFINRGRHVAELDLKDGGHLAQARDLIRHADILIEGFRPGVMERLGLGPDVVMSDNPRLVYGRMTGWGQSGPLAHAAGHDINYIAITGALDSFRSRSGELVSPLNLVGDFGGGALYLVAGVLAALIEARTSGQGQVVDAAMCDGVASMLTMFHGFHAMGHWTEEVGTNLLDGGAHFYGPYKCKDGRFLSVGALEPQFYAELRRLVGIEDDPDFDAQNDRSRWPALTEKLAALFKTRTRDEWVALLEGSDACAAGVAGLFEAPAHPHLAARRTFIHGEGGVQPAPAPRFSRTPSAVQSSPASPLETAADILKRWSAAAPATPS